jgi:uncharacterized repeat protein (TIGR03803 family)
MQTKNVPFGLSLVAAVAAFTALLMAGIPASAQTETILHTFGSGTDGVGPGYSLVLDSHGNLYGTTSSGGAYGTVLIGGTVFELEPQPGGSWTETILHSFSGKSDGSGPYGGVIFDAEGNLYGTSASGGVNCATYGYDCGQVYELKHTAEGWTKEILHSFTNTGKDGNTPYAGLVFDAAGSLYGTTYFGGTYNGGIVFELTPRPGGGWQETILHTFDNNGTDGANLRASLVLDTSGNVYGVTDWGGIYDAGVVFELIHQASGAYSEKILRTFGKGADGIHPEGSLIIDHAGNVYGTTTQGGTHKCGIVFELSPQTGGTWKETTLHTFNYTTNTDGYRPNGSLTSDASGNLYATTVNGGVYDFSNGGYGTVFELSPAAGGTWTESLLHSFNSNGVDGNFPGGNLLLDGSGNLYGTTGLGGDVNAGTVFEITP